MPGVTGQTTLPLCRVPLSPSLVRVMVLVPGWNNRRQHFKVQRPLLSCLQGLPGQLVVQGAVAHAGPAAALAHCSRHGLPACAGHAGGDCPCHVF